MNRSKLEYLACIDESLDGLLESEEFDSVNQKVIKSLEHYRRFAEAVEPPIILELGCGPGTLSRALQMVLEPSRLICVDFSEKMIGQVQRDLGEKAAVEFLCQDIRELDDFDAVYDIIVSSFALHHLTREDRVALFAKCREWLKPGGLFVNGDVFDEEDTRTRDFVNSCQDRRLDSRLSVEQFKLRVEHRKHEHRCSMICQQTDLENAGFVHVLSTFKELDRGVIMAFIQ